MNAPTPAVNFGELQTATLFSQKKVSSDGPDIGPKNFPPGGKVSSEVHRVHEVHTPDDDDLGDDQDLIGAHGPDDYLGDDGIPDDDILGTATDPGTDDLEGAIRYLEDAITRCTEDPAILASDAFRAAARLVRERDPGTWSYTLRPKLKRAKPSGVLLSDIEDATAPPSEGRAEPNAADELVDLVRLRCELWHAPDGACFATLYESPRKTFKLDTKAFAEWLSFAYYVSTASKQRPGSAASETAIRTARTALAGIATNEGPEHTAYLRTAHQDGNYYIDLGDDTWSAIQVSAAGWQVIDAPPVRFWRSSTLRPLPRPTPGGDLDALWTFANIPLADRPLVKACLIESWRPETPFPTLELVGQQGSGKSGTQAKLRRCVDPNAVDLRAAPKSVEDLYVSAGANWVASLNNLSHLTPAVQDAICNLATGGGFAGRTLYTNGDETVVEAKRPVFLNGIVPVVTAQDLTDRVIHVELPRIDAYRAETDLETAFFNAYPGIVGGLLDLFVATLAHLPHVSIDRPPRMADFAHLGEAMMRATGAEEGAFIELYHANRRQSVARNLEACPVAMAVRALVEAANPQDPIVFRGTMNVLLRTLDQHRDQSDAWPKSPHGLGRSLRRQAPALSQIGIAVKIAKPGREGIVVTLAREHCEDRELRSEVFHGEKKFSDDVEVF